MRAPAQIWTTPGKKVWVTQCDPPSPVASSSAKASSFAKATEDKPEDRSHRERRKWGRGSRVVGAAGLEPSQGRVMLVAQVLQPCTHSEYKPTGKQFELAPIRTRSYPIWVRWHTIVPMSRPGRPREDPMLAALLGKTRRRLLTWLFLHQDEGFYVRQLVRIVGGSPGAVPRELERLRAAGLLRRERKGRNVFYRADRESTIFAELRAILSKLSGLTRAS